MKKKLTAMTALLAAMSLFISCNSNSPDRFGWYEDFDRAKEVAQKNDKDILFFVSLINEDERSAFFSENIIRTKTFKDFAKKSLVCVNLDFSAKKYPGLPVDESASEKVKKSMIKLQQKYDKNLRIATSFYVESTPAAFLITKEGYFISSLSCDGSIIKPEDFISVIDSKAEERSRLNALVEATKSGGKIEQARAIDALYEATPPQNRILLANEIERFLELDKENETGLIGKYTTASVNIEVQKAFMNGDMKAAVEALEKITSSDFVTDEEKQQAYYMSAYILRQTDVADIDVTRRIFELLQKAYAASPESEAAPEILQAIEITKEAFDLLQQHLSEDKRERLPDGPLSN
ncbi:hypothetical protein HRQ91_00275 [Treponema parvum]|uniref:Lipoprotein n=1 Tax=Treponema parvum TaxID=138851 RepID=A0A975F276_9SPIR|nr:hypothetical protein [Treponema parvum]QTQ13013.1 hypothetical protein HRQ91_00275 [Treponema parvum]